MTIVVDSSLILAIVRSEPGADRAIALVAGATMSAVNVAEVVTKCIEMEYPAEAALQILLSAGVEIVDLDYALALSAGNLRRRAPKGVLSLGDRACIATAMHLDATAATADAIWETLDLPCKVELIR